MNQICGTHPSFSVAPAKAGVQGRIRSACPPLGAPFCGHDDNCAWIPFVRIAPTRFSPATLYCQSPRRSANLAEGSEILSKVML